MSLLISYLVQVLYRGARGQNSRWKTSLEAAVPNLHAGGSGYWLVDSDLEKRITFSWPWMTKQPFLGSALLVPHGHWFLRAMVSTAASLKLPSAPVHRGDSAVPCGSLVVSWWREAGLFGSQWHSCAQHGFTAFYRDLSQRKGVPLPKGNHHEKCFSLFPAWREGVMR